MKEILVVAEHRRGEIRDITWEMLGLARQLAGTLGAEVVVAVLGRDVGSFAQDLAGRAQRALVIQDDNLENFNSEVYQRILARLIKERRPFLTLIGHTAFGMELAPSLATELALPLVTDCLELDFSGDSPRATRPLYGGKVRAEVGFGAAEGIIATIQAGAFQGDLLAGSPGEILTLDTSAAKEPVRKRFVEYLESAVGDVDITQSDIVVSVGRGIGDAKNISVVEDLAKSLGGVLACSRPVVDKKWLPKFRQVGISGKTVKPKAYIAVGISGAFQHLAGIKGSGLLIAINKDPKAPIFRVADYGIVGDLFAVVPTLQDEVIKIKTSR